MKKRYETIDLAKYISSILVIVIHTAPLLEQAKITNHFITNCVGRIAVPFFLVSSSYFFYKNLQKRGEGYTKTYLLSLLKTYAFWSVLYLPIGLMWVQSNITLPVYLYPFALIIAFLYCGVFYHLWYIPALMFSILVVTWAVKHFRPHILLLVFSALFGFGAIETYYGILPKGFLFHLFENYRNIFITSRNFVFFGLLFVLIGFIIANTKKELDFHECLFGTIFFSALLTIEAFLVYNTGFLDCNFLFMTVPLIYFLFQLLLKCGKSEKINYQKLRQLSEYYYYVHGFFLMLNPIFFRLINASSLYEQHGLIRFFSVLAFTHIISLMIIKAKQLMSKKEKKDETSRSFHFIKSLS